MGRSWDYYNDIAHLYDSQYEEPYWKLYHKLTEKLIERLLLKNNMTAPLSILDLGSGSGLWMEYFVETGNKVTCLEPSKNMTEIIKIKAEALEKDVKIVNGLCEKIPFKEKSFDVVNAQGDVFSYSIDPSEAIREAYRVLKPNGLLIGSVDNLYAFLNDAISVADFRTFIKTEKTKKNQIGNSEVSQQTFETNLFSPEDIKMLLFQNNFVDIEVAGKIVFGLYEEEVIIEEMEKIVEVEEKYAFTKEMMGKAEHLHFSARKPIYK